MTSAVALEPPETFPTTGASGDHAVAVGRRGYLDLLVMRRRLQIETRPCETAISWPLVGPEVPAASQTPPGPMSDLITAAGHAPGHAEL